MNNQTEFISSFNNESSDIVDHDITVPVSTIVTVTMCIVGIFGNSLVIAVVLLGSLRSSVFMNLLMALAISEILYLLGNINNGVGIFGRIYFGPSLLHCRINYYIMFGSGIVSAWITVLISVERYIAVFVPFKVHFYCTKTKTWALILGLTILVCMGLIPIFYVCSVSMINRKIFSCNIDSDNDLNNMISIILLSMICSIIPFTIITILNILIIKKVKLQLAFRAQTEDQQHAKTVSTKNNALVYIMVSVFAVFAVTSFPGAILTTVSYMCQYFKAGYCIFLDTDVLLYSYMLEYINHSTNFFLYCITGSVFRQTLINLCKCKESKAASCFLQKSFSISQNVV